MRKEERKAEQEFKVNIYIRVSLIVATDSKYLILPVSFEGRDKLVQYHRFNQLMLHYHPKRFMVAPEQNLIYIDLDITRQIKFYGNDGKTESCPPDK